MKKADDRYSLLRTRGERPRSSRATDKCDEFASPHTGRPLKQRVLLYHAVGRIVACPLYPRKRTLPGDSCTRSERWRCAVTADAPRTTLKRSIGQFNSNDEDRSAGFKICLIS